MVYMFEFIASILGYGRQYRKYIRPRHGRKRVPDATRNVVFAMYGKRCLRCGSRRNVQIDHVRPVSWGGSNDIGNLQPLCSRCNQSKGARSNADYR